MSIYSFHHWGGNYEKQFVKDSKRLSLREPFDYKLPAKILGDEAFSEAPLNSRLEGY